jgi:hypothetical protein
MVTDLCPSICCTTGTGVTPDIEVPAELARDLAYQFALEHVATQPGGIDAEARQALATLAFDCDTSKGSQRRHMVHSAIDSPRVLPLRRIFRRHTAAFRPVGPVQ